MTNTAGLFAVATITGLALVTCLWLQVAAARYEAPIYWLTVVLVAIFATMAADGVHVRLGVPYVVSTVFFAVALAEVFVVWTGVRGPCRSTVSSPVDASSSTGRPSSRPSPQAPPPAI